MLKTKKCWKEARKMLKNGVQRRRFVKEHEQIFVLRCWTIFWWKIEWQSVESFWTDFEAQEGIILKVADGFEAQEGIIWGTGGSYDIDLKTGPFLDHLTVIIKERL